MPDNQVPYSDFDTSLLEYIRQRQGLATIDEAGRFLANRSLQRKLYLLRGNRRGRAQYPTGMGEKS